MKVNSTLRDIGASKVCEEFFNSIIVFLCGSLTMISKIFDAKFNRSTLGVKCMPFDFYLLHYFCCLKS